MKLARADGSYPRLIDRLAKFHVLFLDDWAMKPLSSQSRHDLLEIIDDRVGRGSTILAGIQSLGKVARGTALLSC